MIHGQGGGCNGVAAVGRTEDIRPGGAAVGAFLPLIGQITAGGGNGKGGRAALGHSYVARLSGDGSGGVDRHGA